MKEYKPNISNPLEKRLIDVLKGSLLNELPLDFIETVFFADLFVRGEVLGAGAFGVIVRVTEISTNMNYAMKIIAREILRSDEIQVYLNEARLLSLIDHDNVIKMKKVFESSNYIFILMEIAEGGSLKSFISTREISRKCITDEECSSIIKQILSGLDYIHKHKIIHRDISPSNVLLRSRSCLNNGVLIVDFGLGIQIDEEEALNCRCGTILYMAPEQLNGDKYNKVNN